MSSPSEPSRSPAGRTAFLFDLDGTLVDSVYQHVLAWREALEKAGMELSVWRIHRRIGMSGGLLLNALLRETGRGVSPEQVSQLQRLHAEAYARLVTQVRRPQRDSLSGREVEVLQLVARGMTNADIGRQLFISEATVKTHLLRAFGKLGVSDRTAAVTTAIERGEIPPPGR